MILGLILFIELEFKSPGSDQLKALRVLFKSDIKTLYVLTHLLIVLLTERLGFSNSSVELEKSL